MTAALMAIACTLLLAVLLMSWRWRSSHQRQHEALQAREEHLTVALWGSGEQFWDFDLERRELHLLHAEEADGELGLGLAVTSRQATLPLVHPHDRVGLLLVTDRVELFVAPDSGRRHVLRLVLELLSFRPKGRGTKLSLGLEYAMRVLKRRSAIFLVSDFLLDETTDPAFIRAARRIARGDLIRKPRVSCRLRRARACRSFSRRQSGRSSASTPAADANRSNGTRPASPRSGPAGWRTSPIRPCAASGRRLLRLDVERLDVEAGGIGGCRFGGE